LLVCRRRINAENPKGVSEKIAGKGGLVWASAVRFPVFWHRSDCEIFRVKHLT
jgi:hypothetical protein